MVAFTLAAGCGPQAPPSEVQQPIAAATPAPTPTPFPQRVKTIPAYQAVKLECLKRGIQVVTGAQLAAMGVKLDQVDVKAMALVHYTQSVPLYFTGQTDQFQPTDAIYFFSDGATQDDHYYVNIEADFTPQTQIFMLHLKPSAHRPLRYAESTFESPSANSPDYPTLQTGGSRHFEENKAWQFFEAPLWRQAPTDFRSWKNLTYPASTRSTPVMDQTFRLPEGNYEQPAQFRLLLIGASDQWGVPIATGHRLMIGLNDKFSIEHTWNGWEPQVVKLEIPADVLQAGDNMLHLELLKPTPMPGQAESKITIDVVNVDWFNIDFEQPTDVFDDANEFLFSAPKTEATSASMVRFSMRNFTSPNVMIFDRATTSRLIAQPFAQAEGSALFAVNLERPDQAGAVVATTLDAALAPYKMERISINADFEEPPICDMLVLSHPDFIKPLERLVEWKRSRGLNVAVVNVKDLFNEHTGGYPKPECLRDFIATTKRSSANLKYVMLVGDSATIAAYQSFVPAYSYLQSGTHANDNYYAAFDDPEGMPQVAVGRLSARTPEHIANYTDKLIAYEGRTHPGDWMGRGLFIGASYDWAQKDCMDLIESHIRPNLLSGYVYTEFFNEDPDYHQKLSDKLFRELNRGSLMVNFFGHGGGSVWEVGPSSQTNKFTRHLFDQSLVAKLENKYSPALVMALTCYTNDFDNPHVAQTLGEAFVNSPGGAIAVIGSAARASISVNKRYTTLFWDQLRKGEQKRLGDLFLESKRAMASPAANAQFILLGDPSLEFSLPAMDIKVGMHQADAAGALSFSYQLPDAVTLPTTLSCTLLNEHEDELGHFMIQPEAQSGEILLQNYLDKTTLDNLPDYYRVVLCAIRDNGLIHTGGIEVKSTPMPTPSPVATPDDATTDTTPTNELVASSD